MANSHPNSRARFVAFAIAGLLGVAVAAQSPRSTEKIVFEGVPFEANLKTNTAVFRDVVITQGDLVIEAAEAHAKGGVNFETGEWTISGNVRIRAEGGNLKADKAKVSFQDKLISRAIITGTPAEFEQLRKDGTTARGHASTIDYQTNSGTVSFTDNAWISYGCTEVTAKQLVYNIKEQRLLPQTEPAPATDPVTGRVRFVIQPKTQAGKPCPAPVPKP
jgi:lipopolysaccharide transport protein LptA